MLEFAFKAMLERLARLRAMLARTRLLVRFDFEVRDPFERTEDAEMVDAKEDADVRRKGEISESLAKCGGGGIESGRAGGK